MSKAFVKEDSATDEGIAPIRRSEPGELRYITPEGFRALQEELSALAGVAGMERSAQQLAATLEEVRVVEPDPAREGRVFFGAWVRLEDEGGEEITYRIVGPDEADAKEGRLSVDSPLAKALLGKEEGDTARVRRPRGTVEYTITGISYTPPSH